MPKKNKVNGSNGHLINGTTTTSDSKKTTNGSAKKKDKNTPNDLSVPLQIGACVFVVIAAVIFLQTDFLKLLGTRDTQIDPSNKNVPKSETDKKPSKSWRKASPDDFKRFGSTICNIDRVNAGTLTVEAFERDYRYKKPVIVKFQNGAKDWTNPKKWSLKSLTREYGLWSVMSGNSREIVRRGGNGDVMTSFSDYVDRLMDDKDVGGEPLYVLLFVL